LDPFLRALALSLALVDDLAFIRDSGCAIFQ
jgi:hypothetical protein